ncbi:MAG: PAS domain-containing protein [Parasporobacterium sp.]|nr:PAS domain-containing protein [Parasporobacterium sp.]
MSVVSLTLGNYIMIAELLGLWVMLESNVHLKKYNDTQGHDVEYRLKVKSGEWRWFHSLGRLLRRENGLPLSYVGMFVDITEKKTFMKKHFLL